MPVHPLKDIPPNRSGLHADASQAAADGPALDAALVEQDWKAKADKFWAGFVATDGYDLLAAIDDGAGPARVGNVVIAAWRSFGKGE